MMMVLLSTHKWWNYQKFDSKNRPVFFYFKVEWLEKMNFMNFLITNSIVMIIIIINFFFRSIEFISLCLFFFLQNLNIMFCFAYVYHIYNLHSFLAEWMNYFFSARKQKWTKKKFMLSFFSFSFLKFDDLRYMSLFMVFIYMNINK